MPTVNETLAQLQRAALEMARGFERATTLEPEQQAEALRDASSALIEMRRTTDGLLQRRSSWRPRVR